MSKRVDIKSYKGTYAAEFVSSVSDALSHIPQNKKSHFIVDERVFDLYKVEFEKINYPHSILKLEANELTKSLSSFTTIIEKLSENGVKRGDQLVAVGGGIIQDITCFLSATLFRGISWIFIPTTLLAQADSCIGSKSSINVGEYKNLLGTFTPPEHIFLCTQFLRTLEKKDIFSGIGEMIKVHMIESLNSFKNLEKDFDKILSDWDFLEKYIYESLLIKKKIIEEDEFDKNIRNILNYGHSFGHAIESATNFEIPHGVAVTIGMDMANYTSYKLNRWKKVDFENHHSLLKKNASVFYTHPVPFEKFIRALSKDKKNTAQHLGLILPNASGKIERTPVENSEFFQSACREYLETIRMS